MSAALQKLSNYSDQRQLQYPSCNFKSHRNTSKFVTFEEPGSLVKAQEANSLFQLTLKRPSIEALREDIYGLGTNKNKHNNNDSQIRTCNNKMSMTSSYPLMDTLNSAMFRLSMEDLVSIKEAWLLE